MERSYPGAGEVDRVEELYGMVKEALADKIGLA